MTQKVSSTCRATSLQRICAQVFNKEDNVHRLSVFRLIPVLSLNPLTNSDLPPPSSSFLPPSLHLQLLSNTFFFFTFALSFYFLESSPPRGLWLGDDGQICQSLGTTRCHIGMPVCEGCQAKPILPIPPSFASNYTCTWLFVHEHAGRCVHVWAHTNVASKTIIYLSYADEIQNVPVCVHVSG